MSHVLKPILTTTLLLLLAMGTALSTGSWAFPQDKAKTCNDQAEKKELKGDDRKNFMQDCMNKGSNTQPPSEMSQSDKMKPARTWPTRKISRARIAGLA